MSGKITNSTVRTLKYFTNPLVEGKYEVVPPPPIPKHIKLPAYATDSNPIYGKYQGSAVVHSGEAIKKLKVSARIARQVLQSTQKFVKAAWQERKPLTEQDIDRYVFDEIIKRNAYPTPIGFMEFPKSVCISVNECIVHGIATKRPLEQGDKINIDVTVFYDGYHGDNNLTVFYGPPKEEAVTRIAELAQQALYKAITICRPGVPFNRIGRLLDQFAAENNIHICDELTGHGVGHLLHMPPQVLHRYHPQLTDVMSPGNVFTIEPVFTYHPITTLHTWKDNFTMISPDNPNAQFEHMVLITKTGCQILTLRDDETIPNPNKNIENLIH